MLLGVSVDAENVSSDTITSQSSAHNQSLVQNYLFPLEKFLKNQHFCAVHTKPPLLPHSRQDVANQMCTKSKEECEKHYMKHFINNPLFASTLLNLKQAEEAQHHETAIPFHCEYPCPALPCLGSAALGRTGTTDPVCFHSQRNNLFC